MRWHSLHADALERFRQPSLLCSPQSRLQSPEVRSISQQQVSCLLIIAHSLIAGSFSLSSSSKGTRANVIEKKMSRSMLDRTRRAKEETKGGGRRRLSLKASAARAVDWM